MPWVTTIYIDTLPETNMAPTRISKRKLSFQPKCFRCYISFSGRENLGKCLYNNILTWISGTFWVGFPYNHHCLGWPTRGLLGNNLPKHYKCKNQPYWRTLANFCRKGNHHPFFGSMNLAVLKVFAKQTIWWHKSGMFEGMFKSDLCHPKMGDSTSPKNPSTFLRVK